MSCPCGSGSESTDDGLQATRYCGGEFVDGAMWTAGNIAPCNFSDLARRICRLRDVG